MVAWLSTDQSEPQKTQKLNHIKYSLETLYEFHYDWTIPFKYDLTLSYKFGT